MTKETFHTYVAAGAFAASLAVFVTTHISGQSPTSSDARIVNLRPSVGAAANKGAAVSVDAAVSSNERQVLLQRILAQMPREGRNVLSRPQDLFRDFPELRLAYLESIAAWAELQFGPFLGRHGFTAEKVKEFCNAYIEGEKAWAENQLSPFADSTDKETASLKIKAALAERDEKMQSIIGEEGFDQFKAYIGTRDFREGSLGLKQFAKLTLFGQNPISIDQFDSLTDSALKLGIGTTDLLKLPADEQFREYATIAGKILDSEQLDAFDAMLGSWQMLVERSKISVQRQSVNSPANNLMPGK